MDTTGRLSSPIASLVKGASFAFAVTIGVFWLFSHSASGEQKSPECSAALETVDYGTGLSIPDDLKTLIDSYRSDWKKLCSPQERSKPSLAEIFVKAQKIKAAFHDVFDAFDASIINETAFDPRRSEAINNLVSKQYPSFVPGFEGAYGEHEMFAPSIEAFRRSASMGNTEDRTFFQNQISLEGDFPPYIEKTWDYGGCTLYGEFDWTGTLKGIARVKKQVKNPAYLNESSLLEKNLFLELEPSYDICTCRKKESVLKDLRSIEKYLKKEPAFAANASRIQQSIDAIQSGRIQVKSEAEKHCSGG